eukprot:809470-Prorocentrum_lima.AAC.1
MASATTSASVRGIKAAPATLRPGGPRPLQPVRLPGTRCAQFAWPHHAIASCCDALRECFVL